MKRVKVMLSAIAVLAIVGGTLAFKAQKGTFSYCVLSTDETQGDFCTSTFLQKRNAGSAEYFTSTIANDCTKVTCNGQPIALTNE